MNIYNKNLNLIFSSSFSLLLESLLLLLPLPLFLNLLPSILRCVEAFETVLVSDGDVTVCFKAREDDHNLGKEVVERARIFFELGELDVQIFECFVFEDLFEVFKGGELGGFEVDGVEGGEFGGFFFDFIDFGAFEVKNSDSREVKSRHLRD
jgi:hypothetical protein